MDVMSNNKQTAVEWLSEIIRFANKELYAEMFEEIEQAKQMEKQQVKDAYLRGIKNYDPTFKSE